MSGSVATAALIGIFFGAMFGSMFVAWLIGSAVELADTHPGLTPREIELDAWIDETLRSGS